MTRRSFLATVGAISFGTALPFPARRLTRVGLQLYSVRHLLERDWSGTLAEIASIGYREVEFAGYFDRPPRTIRHLLDRLGLAAPAGHFSKEDLLAPSAAALDTAAVVGHSWVIVAWIAAEERRSLDGWRRIADDLNRIGERCRTRGLRFAYHNEDYDFAPAGGRIPFDVLLEATDPHLVDLELDLYWLTKGGGDPATYLARTAGRTRLVHVKDSAGPPAHRMVDVGQGALDWRRLVRTAWRAGVRHYFVEHDDPADPLAFCRTSYTYLSRLEF
jgi:sugar phosphate isomerase/epimerase